MQGEAENDPVSRQDLIHSLLLREPEPGDLSIITSRPHEIVVSQMYRDTTILTEIGPPPPRQGS